MVLNESKNLFESDGNHPKTDSQSLLDKYKIPVQHFEYSFIEKCNDGRELERIVEVLRSGEEGYFPDLTKFAENRLTVVKPKSKLLRQACPVISKSALNQDERNEIMADLKQWVSNVTKNDDELAFFKNRKSNDDSTPGIREKKEEHVEETKKITKRLSSTDYSSWDKYDPDTEILKMDLEEEKLKQLATEKKKKTAVKRRVHFKNFISEAEALQQANYEKDKGNEFFKVGDYKEASEHYTNSINCKPTIAAFTNRALTQLRMKKFQNALDDCHAALAIDPRNIKALVRKAQALDGLGKHDGALETAEQAIEIDPNNSSAQELAEKCRKSCGKTAKNTVRFVVEEVENVENTNNNQPTEEDVNQERKTGNKPEDAVIIPIPGTSTMKPPHYITCSDGDFQKLKAKSIKVGLPTHMTSVDNSDIDDDDNCTVNHLKPSKDTSNEANLLDTFKPSDNNNSKNNDLNATKNCKSQMIQEFSCPNDGNSIGQQPNNITAETRKEQSRAATDTHKKIIPRQVHKDDKRAGGEPSVNSNGSFTIPEDIHSPYTFLKTWSSANSDRSYEQHARILKTIDVNRIAEVIGCKLDNSMFSTIINCLSVHFTVPGEVGRLQLILENLILVPRFSIISMFMSAEDRNCISTLLDFLKQHGKTVSKDVYNKFFNNYFFVVRSMHTCVQPEVHLNPNFTHPPSWQYQ